MATELELAHVTPMNKAIEYLGLSWEEFCDYVDRGELTPYILKRKDGNRRLFVRFFGHRGGWPNQGFFKFDCGNYGTVFFDCEELQKFLDTFATQKDEEEAFTCPEMASMAPMAPKPPMAQTYAPTPLPLPDGRQSEELAQAGGSVAELEKENQDLKQQLAEKEREIERLKKKAVKPFGGIDWLEGQVKQDQERLKASIPRYGLLNQVEEERDHALKRIAELERQLDGKALPQDRDALEKVRKELEAEKASHARARKELEEKIKRLERLEKAIGMPEDWSQATERKYPPIVRVVGYRLQGKDRDYIAAEFARETVKSKRYGELVDADCFTQSQIDALLSEDPIEELSRGQIGVLIDKGGQKAADSYERSGKRAIIRGLKKSVPPDSQ